NSSNRRSSIMQRAWTRVLFLLVWMAGSALAQQQPSNSPTSALISLLQQKGMISANEAAALRQSSSGQLEQKLAELLLTKGVITQQEYQENFGSPAGTTNAPVSDLNITPGGGAETRVGLAMNSQPQAAARPEAPKFVPAVAPLRVLPITIPKREGLIPDLKLGSGVSLRPYGFFKMSAVHQTASHGGPTFGSNDFPQGPSLLLAWVRMDTKLFNLPWFVQFGQDWSIFGSSTLMDLFETTGFGFAQGNLYERMPMFRTGVQFGQHDFKIQPEFAIALSSFGEPGLDDDQRTRFGGRVGAESGRPELQARAVFQF